MLTSLAKKVDERVWRELGFIGRPAFSPINGFAYLMSLGFKAPSLLPRSLAPALIALDRALPARLTAMRVELRARKAMRPSRP